MLLTRPEADSRALKAEIEALGYPVMIEPLLSIEPIMQPKLDLAGVQAVVLTSAHAVSGLTEDAKACTIYTVGDATAAAARKAGCRSVHVAAGNAKKLSQMLVEKCRSQDGTILHLSGEVVREGLAEFLQKSGFDYRRQPVYRAKARACFSDEVIDAWRRRAIRAVLLFSPRTSVTLVDLLRRHELVGYVDKAAAICLSEETAAPCKTVAWSRIIQAARPTSHALIGALVGSITIC
ncbi:MAG: uroporphyrinogen-III synthase [Geminicoccales bacterium]